MFRKVLVANRGEIAVRIIRALRELGVGSVAVYSEADRRSLHVLHADEAYCIGPAPAAHSYLDGARLLQVARTSGAEAVHPGYGFLAENAEFAAAVQAAGLTFIGPSPAAMNALGNKLLARRLALAAGVPTVPGLNEPANSLEAAKAAAAQVGYPVLLKASAGGGGKGMRVVRSEAQLASAFELTRGEARSAFANDEVYLERYLEDPRHVEIQFLADAGGRAVYLGERDCSVQRRHQKLIEESPAPGLRPEVRRAMGECAVRLALQAGYVSAGTAEFMVDSAQGFYFLEVNARLQVEHPVTEVVTGLDLVKLQLLIAAGGALPFTQADIQPRGHAIECRITAEDPEHDFRPSTGRVPRFRLPSGPGLRNDAGLYAGAEVSPYYDSMVAKLIAWGGDREEARLRMLRGLGEYVIEGVKTSIPFHRWALTHPAFIAGGVGTSFVAAHHHPGSERPSEADELLAVRAAALHSHLHPAGPPGPGGGEGLGRLGLEDRRAPRAGVRDARMKYQVRLADRTYWVDVEPEAGGWRVSVDGTPAHVDAAELGPGAYSFLTDGRSREAAVDRDGDALHVRLAGASYEMQVLDEVRARTQRPERQALASGPATLKAPMPGLVVELRVKEGDAVEEGAPVVIMEAMKMQNELGSPAAGRVQTIHVVRGQTVESGQALLTLARGGDR